MASTGTTLDCCVRKVMCSDTAWSHSNWTRAFASRTVRRILRRRFESVNSALELDRPYHSGQHDRADAWLCGATLLAIG